MLNESSTVQELLTEIRTQKERLISEKKIKKARSLPCITDDEKPFEIPSTWKWVRLGEVLQIINGDRGKNYPSKKELHETGDIPFISALNINDDTISTEQLLYVDKKRYDILRSGKLKKGDLVLCIRGSLGKNCRYPFETGAIASSLVIIRSYLKIDFIYDYMAYYLNSLLFKEEMSQYDNGTAQPNLGARDLSLFAVPLPPLAEQQRIVARVKSLFAKLDAAKAKVQSVLDAHEARKAALLHDAFTGKLTAKWRKEYGVTSDSWYTDTLKNLCEKITDGTHHSPPNSDKGDYMYVTAKNIKETGIELDNITYVSSAVHEEIYKRCDVQKGDVLYIKDGATTGIATVNTLDEPFSLLSSVAVLRPHEERLLSGYLKHLLNSSEQKSKMINNMSGNAITRLTLSKLKETSIKVCSLAEQQEIVRILDRLLGREEQVRQSAESVLETIDRMKQSILARAFRGEL